jgi:hypothetical protein
MGKERGMEHLVVQKAEDREPSLSRPQAGCTHILPPLWEAFFERRPW